MKIFDFDGTLVDSNGVWVEVDLRFLGSLGLSPTREYSDLMGHSIFPIAAQITKNYYHLDLTPEEIMFMDWLCDNVEGSIPEFDQLLPSSQEMVRVLGVYRDKIPPETEEEKR